MLLALFQTWESTKNHVGLAPAAPSLHLSERYLNAYVLAYNAALPGVEPAEFDRPCGKTETVRVSLALYERLVANGGSLRNAELTLRVSEDGSRQVFETPVDDNLSFIEQVLQGRAKLSQVDDFVERWHALAAKEGASSIPLARHLGLDEDDYAKFVKDPDALLSIVFSKALARHTGGFFRHRKSGGDYLVLAQGKLEANGASVTVYLGTDGQVWVRDQSEFADGRFAPLAKGVQTTLKLAD